MRAFATGLVLAIVVGACLPPAGRLFRTTLSNPDGAYPLPVALGDETELVTGIEPALPDPRASLEVTVQQDSADPRARIVTWVGGACDDDAALSFRPSGSEYELHLEVHAGLGSCVALGVVRGLRIKLSESIPLGSIRASGSG